MAKPRRPARLASVILRPRMTTYDPATALTVSPWLLLRLRMESLSRLICNAKKRSKYILESLIIGRLGRVKLLLSLRFVIVPPRSRCPGAAAARLEPVLFGAECSAAGP